MRRSRARRTKVYELIATGALVSVTVDRRRLVLASSIADFVARRIEEAELAQ